jgi:ankyrin repeat protein
LLIPHGRIDVNQQDSRYGQAMAHFLVKNNNLYLLKLLFTRDVNLEVQDIYGETPLHYAAERGHIGVVQAILSHAKDSSRLTNILDTGGRTALRAAQINRQRPVVELLAPLTDQMLDPLGWSELHHAAWNGHWMLVSGLVLHAAGNMSQDKLGNTALHLAARRGYVVIAKLLVAAGAESEVVKDALQTASDVAGEYGHENIVRYLEMNQACMAGTGSRDYVEATWNMLGWGLD